MKPTKPMQWLAALLAGTGLLLPQSVLAQSPDAGSYRVTGGIGDVRLAEDGAFRGAVLDSEGRPLADCHVVVLHDATPIAKVKTDAQGRFEVLGVRSGVHQVAAGKVVSTYRIWKAGTDTFRQISKLVRETPDGK